MEKLFRVETKANMPYTTFDTRLMTTSEIASFLEWLTGKMPNVTFKVEIEYIPLQSDNEPAKPDTTA